MHSEWFIGLVLALAVAVPPPETRKPPPTPKPVPRRVAPPHARTPMFITKPDGSKESQTCREERGRMYWSTLPCGSPELRTPKARRAD